MEKSKHFDEVKEYYDGKYWKINRVLRAVEKKWISEDEYKKITGFEYPNVE